MWTLGQKKGIFVDSSIWRGFVTFDGVSFFLAVGIVVDSSIWRGFVTFDGVSFFSGRNSCR